MVDAYTKLVLTVIAVMLMWLALVFTQAMSGNGHRPLDVRIVAVGTTGVDCDYKTLLCSGWPLPVDVEGTVVVQVE